MHYDVIHEDGSVQLAGSGEVDWKAREWKSTALGDRFTGCAGSHTTALGPLTL